MKILLLSLLLAACARVPTPSIDGEIVIDAMNAATADPNFGGMFLVFMVIVMFLALLALPGSR